MAFPSFREPVGILPDARQEFLFACALHQLIPESSIERLLGDIPTMDMPHAGRLVKANLVAQYAVDSKIVQKLVGHVENMDGNVGEAVGAIVEVGI